MPILGAHMSIAGGHYNAAVSAHQAGCDCVQIFTKNNNQWKAREITDKEAKKFRLEINKYEIQHTLSHASYLINLASPNEELRKKSVDAFVIELLRAEKLGIEYVVVHPGSYTTSYIEAGIETIVRSLDEVHDELPVCTSKCLLENTAGQGTNLGYEFEQLQQIIEGVKEPDRVGVCIDTCHAFAAGYPMATKSEYKETIRKIKSTVGLKCVRAFHLNDSKQPLGSRKDRNEHIGLGEMGLEPFRNLLNDKRFEAIPMYIETPRGTDDDGRDFDEVNLKTLRSLIA